MNYELDSYLDAIRDFPETNLKLQSEKGFAFHQKTDIFRRMMWYSYEGESENFIALPVNRVKEIIELNKRGEKPAELLIIDKTVIVEEKKPDFENVVGQDSLTRFDNQRRNKNKNKHKNRNRNNNNRGNNKNNNNRNNPK